MAFDDVVMTLATQLEVCLSTALSTRPNPPGDVCQVTGEGFQQFLSAGLTEDRCCSGFAAVRIAGVVPKTPVSGTFENCSMQVWQINLEMGVARCAPVGTINAGPSCAQLLAVVDQVQSDMAAMMEAVCCLRPQVESGQLEATGWLPFGPDGACTGGIMGVSVLVDACGCAT